MKNNNIGRWDATIGIHEDGTKEVLTFGRCFHDTPECRARTANHYGCADVYYVRADEMTDEEIEMVSAAYNEFFDYMMQWVK